MPVSRKRLVLLCAALTSSLIMLDSNIVAVALPSIARDLHTGFVGVQWVISAYLITFAALLLPAGSLADLYGRRRIVTIGLAVFLASSTACGLATSAIALEMARAVQGVGGSLLLTAALAIITATFTGAERAKAFAFWGTAIGVAITMGPVAGGIITGLFGWRWAFLVNVPLCIAFIVAVRAVVPESRDPQARRLDVFGALTLSCALFALVAALIDGNRLGWLSAGIVLRLCIAAICTVAFLVVEKTQRRPMLDLDLFRHNMFLGAAAGMFGYAASAQVMIFFLPIYLQGAFGLGPLAAGFGMLPFAVPLVVVPRVAAHVFAGWSHRNVLIAGLALAALGDLLFAALAPFGLYPAVAIAMVVAGIGTGVLNPETARAMQAQIPPERAGMAAGIGGTLRFVSLLVGVAVLGAVMARFHPALGGGADPRAAAAFAAVSFVAAGTALVSLLATALLMRSRPAPQLVVSNRTAGVR